MIGGFFCVPDNTTGKSKKRKTSGNKTKKAKKGPSGKAGRKSFRKFVRGSKQTGGCSSCNKGMNKKKGMNNKKVKKTGRHSMNKKGKKYGGQKGGATLKYKLDDPLGRGTYPVTENGRTDCSGVHHK
jgi:hypothetical protein